MSGAVIRAALAELAAQLGVEAGEGQAAGLEALLDDDFERLDEVSQRRAEEQLAPALAELRRCEPCGLLSLPRYASDDGRCRRCGAAATAVAPPPRIALVDVRAHVPSLDPSAVRSWPLADARRPARRLDDGGGDGGLEELVDARARLERERREARARARPALGCIRGERAGEIVALEAQPGGRVRDAAAPTEAFVSPLPTGGEGAVLFVGREPAIVSGALYEPGARCELSLGAVLEFDGAVYVLDEVSELAAPTAEAVHILRDDGQPGGPWPYWDEPQSIGASSSCAVRVVDDAVADEHALLSTRFGRLLIEDRSPEGAESGLFVGGERRSWALLAAGRSFRLGSSGPVLRLAAGPARVKLGAKARAMKPARHKTTVLELLDADGAVTHRLFLFARREVRFGDRARLASDPMRVVNEMVLRPPQGAVSEIAEKQGALALTRDGVSLRRDGGADMFLDGEELAPGQPVSLKRRFALSLGETIAMGGRLYRSPTDIQGDQGPPRLGVYGGHPCECLRLDRTGAAQSFVFLVRLLRIGSDEESPWRVDREGVRPDHLRILLERGRFMVVAPHAAAPAWLGELQMDPAVPYPLQLDTVLRFGEARVRFRVPNEALFALSSGRVRRRGAGRGRPVELGAPPKAPASAEAESDGAAELEGGPVGAVEAVDPGAAGPAKALEGRCPICKVDVAAGGASCPACATPHHAACLSRHGGCGIEGCRGSP